MASAYALRGDAGHAARYLREAVAQLPGLNRARARVDPDFDPVRADPEFAAVLG